MKISEFFSPKKKDGAGDAEGARRDESPAAQPFAKSILVVVDGSEASAEALRIAVQMKACLADARLAAAFVVDTASMDMLQQMRVFIAEERSLFESEIEAKGQRVLDNAHDKAQKLGIELETYMLKGRFSQVVLRAARELKSDMIVICGWHDASTHKDNTSVERQLLVDHALCPVLVVKR